MQQRQLRLGDILDDYCPRERRLANHTVVAMVGNDVQITRCTTCDTEHPFKGGKVPRLRKKKTSVEAAYDEVLESVTKDAQPHAVLVTNPDSEEPDPPMADDDTQADPAHSDNGSAPAEMAPEEVRLHRPLIRAQLPRIEREPVARPAPEFTIRQASKARGRFQNNNTRPGRFAKSGGQGGGGNSRGPAGGQGGRPGGGGRPQGHGGPMRPAGGRPQGHGGPRKRSR
jgi:hypothetical protein